MLGSIVNFFLDWKVKLLVLAIILVSLFAYHKVEVNKAVTQATNELRLEYSKEVFRQIEIAKDESIKLKQEKEKADAEYKKNLASANARYSSLIVSLSDRPSRAEAKPISDDSRSDTAPARTDGTGLYKEDAEFLARFARDAEELKENLKACLTQYESVKNSIENEVLFILLQKKRR